MEKMAGNPDLVTPFGAGPVTSSVSLKTPASEYNVHDTFRYGFKSAKSDLTPSHPLEASEANFAANREAFVMQSLRNSQGLHAPLRLEMERKMASKIQRIPPLESSMIALETLLGQDETISVEELLDNPSDSPVLVNGRAVMEKRLKMF
ncbi:PREDICTED: proteasome maturation protein-like [Amphimedon queenslandica]|uniref:Proteasome maturation protein n=2 Tax=Amphimedon queenslandica TaxID=400682 RepID=A0A1X7TXA5_AMPQE|nr:PREDICTED: proteasome maturation protein-like [Amphimedon queenslandica]|eukprot:XP_003389588.1 PREDICTED: proteasome maturation protein-like [Amphimedon queenslandica]